MIPFPGKRAIAGLLRRMTLTQRMLAMTAIALLPVLTALGHLILSVHGEREREAHETALRTGQLASLEMERIVSGAQATLFALAGSQLVRTFDSPACDRYLAEVSAALPQFYGISAADAAGRVRCSSLAAARGASLQAEPYFEEATTSGGFVVGEFTPGDGDAAAYLPLALPIVEQGRTIGVLVGRLDLVWLGDRVAGRDLGEGGSLTIADRSGIILARAPQLQRFVGTRIPDAFMPLVDAEHPGTIEVTSQDGTHRVIGYFPPAATDGALYVSAGISTDSIFAPIYASTYRSIAIATAGATAAFALAWLAAGRLVRAPIRRIVATIDAWRRGDATARTGIASSGNELSALAEAIDRYMDELVADRAARRQAEAHRDLLFDEMNHRVKNILATVQALAKTTLRDKVAPDALRDLERRLEAMAGTHDMLLSANWQRGDLRETIEAALRPFGLEDGDRLKLDGPPLLLTARAALALSMVVHELGTNAAKYGALSDAAGTVAIEWRVAPGGAGPRFVLRWTERGGPAVAAPERSGFGTRMIEAALGREFGAEVRLRFPSDGVAFTLDADAARMLAGPETDSSEAA